jgi:protein-S-isoprenylcysteine O-methyltransferase Ste14
VKLKKGAFECPLPYDPRKRGVGLAFRSGVGVLLAALMIPPLIARIRAEERLLRTELGADYDAYRARTSRLIPGLY